MSDALALGIYLMLVAVGVVVMLWAVRDISARRPGSEKRLDFTRRHDIKRAVDALEVVHPKYVCNGNCFGCRYKDGCTNLIDTIKFLKRLKDE